MFLTAVILLIGLWFIYDRFINGKNLPPGPMRLPLLGTLIQMGKKKKKFPAPHIMMQEFSKEYGPIITLQYGMKRQVVVDDYHLIRQTMQADDWMNRPIDQFLLERSFNKPLGIIWGNGKPWQEIRRFSIRTLRDFGFGKTKGQDAAMEEELDELFRRLNDKLGSSSEASISMSQFFTVSVLNILWSMMAGTRFNHDDHKLQTLVKNIYDNIRFINVAGNILMAFPPLRTAVGKVTGVGEARKKLIANLQGQFQSILNERRALGHYKDEQKDFVDVFLVEIDKHKNETDAVYTDQQFSTCALDLFLAGSETTSNTLEFALLYMILNPQVQKKVQEEIDREIGSAFPTAIMKNKMPYTEATLLEIQRIASVVPMVVRAPTKDVNINSYEIKEGTFTIFNLYSAHRNPTVWENPEEFKPERFLSESNEIINSDKILPFGQGKRLCMGEVLARATLFTYFVRFLQNYSIEKSPNHPPPTTASLPGLTLAPEPYYALIKKRE